MQNKRDLYIYKILKDFYYGLRKTLADKGHHDHLLLLEGYLREFPQEDEPFFRAALNKIISKGLLKIKKGVASLHPKGVIYFEEIYKPSDIIHFSSLIFPFLKLCYEINDRNENITNINDFVDKIKNSQKIIIKENEHLEVLYILKTMGLISLIEASKTIYQNITPKGINVLLDNTPPDIIETIINRNVKKFLNLDYYPKEDALIKSRIFKWVNQFTEGDDRIVAAFLLDKLWIIPNQWCLDKFEEFRINELSSINKDDIYIFAVKGSGSSGEYWRHKFFRDLDFEKENLRTINTLENESDKQFWDYKVILFIDDIIGSGQQFLEFIEEYMLESQNLQNRFHQSRVIYYTIIATEFGIKEISKIIPKIEFFYGKLLKKLFDDDNSIWKKSTIISKEIIKEMCEKYGNKLLLNPDFLLGYKDSQLLIGFQDHTPDNTIPILWVSNNWQNLLQR
ncbi:MAG: hypothetical protein EU529_14825 [Promethearchaeota archaeon]|nr:MAG: hypothetical protein EU529_14825 [Candidatus Lokiarchaeota archaeon]